MYLLPDADDTVRDLHRDLVRVLDPPPIHRCHACCVRRAIFPPAMNRSDELIQQHGTWYEPQYEHKPHIEPPACSYPWTVISMRAALASMLCSCDTPQSMLTD